jgi:hypothetical protein
MLGAAACAVVMSFPTAAAADVGTGVGASPIQLAAPAEPGHSYQLPALYVINTGTVTSSYQVRVQPVSSDPGRAVPSPWVRFVSNDFALRPRQSTYVRMVLTVPADAPAGSYGSDLLVGKTTPTRSKGEAVLGAQAATKLAFRVDAPARPFRWPWWADVAIAVAALVVAGTVAIRRYGLQIRVERRR